MIFGELLNAAKQLGSQAAKLDNSENSQKQHNDTDLFAYSPNRLFAGDNQHPTKEGVHNV